MARLVIKNGYLKGGSEKTAAHLSYLVKYIATREGVEKVLDGREHWRPTKKQDQMVEQLVRDFPDTKESHEYDDYLASPNRENASEFISAALEQHLDKLGDRKKYLSYIANRPRVELLGTHGLFCASPDPIVLEQVAQEISQHTGSVWTPIISLRREDAARLSFESAEAWRALLCAKSLDIASALKIHPDNLRWYAAFHNESHHPHIHMICYSADPKEGYLNREGIRQMKSALVNEIFKAELTALYTEKSTQRDVVKKQAAETLRQLTRQMRTDGCNSPRIELLIAQLAQRLNTTTGKKQYGYLKADVKNIVDEIVEELSKDAHVAETYRLWWELKQSVNSTYGEPRQKLPLLSRCADFKPIRNMVIQEAVRIANDTITFEEPRGMDSEFPEPPETGAGIDAEDGDAAYHMGRRYLGGNGVLKDTEKAIHWLELSAQSGNSYAEYALGVLCLKGEGLSQNTANAIDYFKRSAAHGNVHAQYRLGKLYLAGEVVPKDARAATEYLSAAAAHGNQYAQYALGKLYLTDTGVEQDKEAARDLLTRSAAQGNACASFVLEHFDKAANGPSVFLAATRLLHHLSRIFEDTAPMRQPIGLKIDRKRMLKLRQKKIAAGHRPDDHEDEININMRM